MAFAALSALCTVTTATAQTTVAGFTTRTLVTQRRLAPVAPANVVSALRSAICSIDCAHGVSLGEGKLRSRGRDWQLDVDTDGTSARYENLALERRRMLLARDPSQKIPVTELEILGRRAIASTLRDTITLAAHERLVPVRTDYLIAGVETIKKHETQRYVLANRIVFGRLIDGVPVVGGGSRVVLTFANNDALESFRYDWPRYERDGVANPASMTQIARRVDTVVGARFDASRAPATARNVGGTARPTRAASAGKTEMSKLECGYYDPGAATYRTGATIQPGCVYHVVKRDGHGFREGFAGAVPGGTAFARDGAWPESLVLPRGR